MEWRNSNIQRYISMLAKLILRISQTPLAREGYLLFFRNALFQTVSRNLDLIMKGKRALDNLFDAGKISPPTYEYLNREVTDAVNALEKHRRAFTEKIDSRAKELEEQLGSLELLLANLEIHHISGEVDEESYRREKNLFILGIDATKKEATHIKEAPFMSTPPTAVTNTVPLARPPQKSVETHNTLAEPDLEDEGKEELIEEIVKEVAAAAPETAVETTAKRITNETAEKDKTVRKEKENPPEKVLVRKVKAPTTKPSTEKAYARGNSGRRCRNPWNGQCKNTDIEVCIYYNEELLPICRDCWLEIAEKDLIW